MDFLFLPDDVTSQPNTPAAAWKTQFLLLLQDAPMAYCIEPFEEYTENLITFDSCHTSKRDLSKSTNSLISDEISGQFPPKQDERMVFYDNPAYQSKEPNSTSSRCLSVSTCVKSSRVSGLSGSTTKVNEMKNEFGSAFHGALSEEEARLYLFKDGQYLVRKRVSTDSDYILSIRFDGELLNYLVSYDANTAAYYLVGKPKPYPTLREMVQEGLITMHLDAKAGSYIELMLNLALVDDNEQQVTRRKSNMPRKPSYLSISRQNSSLSSTPIMEAIPATPVLLELDLNRHSFHLEKSSGTLKCDVCRKKVTGKQNLECKDCGVWIHELCLENLYGHCLPDLHSLGEVFGTDLTTLVKATGGSKPPFVITKCIEAIEDLGLEVEGIYRISGPRRVIDQIIQTLEKDRDETDLSDFVDIHALCGVVKRYFRELPEPLITTDAFNEFLNFVEDHKISLEVIQMLARSLPSAHQITLHYLLQHLHRVASHSKTNKMNPFNLSSVLAPSIVCPVDVSLNTMKVGSDILDFMIRHSENLYEH